MAASGSVFSSLDLQSRHLDDVDKTYPPTVLPCGLPPYWYPMPMIPFPQDHHGQYYIPPGHPVIMAPFPQSLVFSGIPHGYPSFASTMASARDTMASKPHDVVEVLTPPARTQNHEGKAASLDQPVRRLEHHEQPRSVSGVRTSIRSQKDTFSIGVSESEWPKPCEAAARNCDAMSSTAELTCDDEARARRDNHKAGQSIKQILETIDTVNKPPPNAPKGPKALRKSHGHGSESQEMAFKGTNESGSWSQSRKWVSGETKERMAFHKMKLSLRHIQADRSPFVPQSPTALVAFRLEETKRKVEKEKQILQREVERRKAKNHRTKGLQLYCGKKFADPYSPVLAWNHCFAEG